MSDWERRGIISYPFARAIETRGSAFSRSPNYDNIMMFLSLIRQSSLMMPIRNAHDITVMSESVLSPKLLYGQKLDNAIYLPVFADQNRMAGWQSGKAEDWVLLNFAHIQNLLKRYASHYDGIIINPGTSNIVAKDIILNAYADIRNMDWRIARPEVDPTNELAALVLAKEYVEIDAGWSQWLTEQRSKWDREVRDLARKSRNKTPALVAWGSSAALFGLGFLFANEIGVALMLIASFAFILGNILFFKDANDSQRKVADAQLRKTKRDWAMEIQLVNLELSVERSRRDVDNAWRMIPESYRTYDALVTMGQYVLDGRVNNWPEAVNLYENSLYQRRMEAKTDQAIWEAQQAQYVANRAANQAMWNNINHRN
jgi:hypothetical protein